MEVKNEVMELFRVVDGGSEPTKSVVHPSLSYYEHTDQQHGPMQVECHNLFDEESNPPIVSPIYRGFRKFSRPPLYDEYEDSCLDDEGPKWNSSSFFSNT